MNTNHKFWIVLAVALASVVTLACSCGALSSILATPTPLPTSTSVPTRTPIPSPTPKSEPMPGLAGVWRDTAEGTNHTIVWDGDSYRVVSSINDNRGVYSILSEDWNGGTFTFVYSVPNGADVTIECVSVSGNTLAVNWSSTNGNSGTDTFTRQP